MGSNPGGGVWRHTAGLDLVRWGPTRGWSAQGWVGVVAPHQASGVQAWPHIPHTHVSPPPPSPVGQALHNGHGRQDASLVPQLCICCRRLGLARVGRPGKGGRAECGQLQRSRRRRQAACWRQQQRRQAAVAAATGPWVKLAVQRPDQLPANAPMPAPVHHCGNGLRAAVQQRRELAQLLSHAAQGGRVTVPRQTAGQMQQKESRFPGSWLAHAAPALAAHGQGVQARLSCLSHWPPSPCSTQYSTRPQPCSKSTALFPAHPRHPRALQPAASHGSRGRWAERQGRAVDAAPAAAAQPAAASGRRAGRLPAALLASLCNPQLVSLLPQAQSLRCTCWATRRAAGRRGTRASWRHVRPCAVQCCRGHLRNSSLRSALCCAYCALPASGPAVCIAGFCWAAHSVLCARGVRRSTAAACVLRMLCALRSASCRCVPACGAACLNGVPAASHLQLFDRLQRRPLLAPRAAGAGRKGHPLPAQLRGWQAEARLVGAGRSAAPAQQGSWFDAARRPSRADAVCCSRRLLFEPFSRLATLRRAPPHAVYHQLGCDSASQHAPSPRRVSKANPQGTLPILKASRGIGMRGNEANVGWRTRFRLF